MLEADAIRNPGSPTASTSAPSGNRSRPEAWASTRPILRTTASTRWARTSQSRPDARPSHRPPLVTLAITAATATEAGPTSGTITISREAATEAALAVNFTVAGTATRGVDYAELPATATIPAGAVAVDVAVVPLDDATLEGNETVVVTLRSGPGYILAPPTVGTVTIVSDDVAPDFTVTVLTGPALGGAGLTLDVTDTTRNQGTGPSGESTTSFYLSLTTALDATDPLVGTRQVPGLLPGTNDVATTTLMVPAGTAAGTYSIIAKADGPGSVTEPNEANNTRTLLVRVGPDLAVTALTAPAVAGPGAIRHRQRHDEEPGRWPRRRLVDALLSVAELHTRCQRRRARITRRRTAHRGRFDDRRPPRPSRFPRPLRVARSTSSRSPMTATRVAESTENNNTRFVTIRIGADLVVSALTAPTRVGSGSTISVTDTIRNSGGGGSRTVDDGLLLVGEPDVRRRRCAVERYPQRRAPRRGRLEPGNDRSHAAGGDDSARGTSSRLPTTPATSPRLRRPTTSG